MEKSRRRRIIKSVAMGALLTTLLLVASIQKLTPIRLPGLTGIAFITRWKSSGAVAYWATTRSVKFEMHSHKDANDRRYDFSVEVGGKNGVNFSRSPPEK